MVTETNPFWEHMATRMTTTGEFDHDGASVSPRVAKKASVKSVAGTPQLKDGDKESPSVNTRYTSVGLCRWFWNYIFKRVRCENTFMILSSFSVDWPT